MDYEYYKKIFSKVPGRLFKELLKEKRIEISTGLILDSVFLKMYKKEWTSDPTDPMNAEARIFFSVWLNDKTIAGKKLYYNIHALKLRKLKGYDISSRAFADEFRKKFRSYAINFENVSVNFGPLTLMEGWVLLDDKTILNSITILAENFLMIDGLIDKTLNEFKPDQIKNNKEMQQVYLPEKTSLKDGDQCKVTVGTHKGKSGTVRDINFSKTGHITITVVQKNGDRFKTLGRNVTVEKN